jgi:hypothetical protein
LYIELPLAAAFVVRGREGDHAAYGRTVGSTVAVLCSTMQHIAARGSKSL